MPACPPKRPLDRTFQALADPTRRSIVVRLTQGPASVSELAAPLRMSLPAVVQHLDVLQRCGLVSSKKVGRVRTCRLEPAPMRSSRAGIAQHREAGSGGSTGSAASSKRPTGPRMSVTHAHFTIERRYPWTPAQTFSAFADARLKGQWFASRRRDDAVGARLPGRRRGGQPRRPGGARRYRCRYHDIVPDERIVFAYDLRLDRRLMSVSLTTVELFADGRGRGWVHRARRVLRRPDAPAGASTGPASCSTRWRRPGRGAGG